MDIFISNNDEPHYYVGFCFSCGFLTIDFGRKSLNIWWLPPKSLMRIYE